MTLKEFLTSNQLTTAVIIDDGYDELPQPGDLAEAEWSNFFADLSAEERKSIIAEYPTFEEEKADALSKSPAFVPVLWSLREKLEPTQRNAVFGTYEQKAKMEREYLSELESALKALGIEPARSGRSPVEQRAEAIVFMDLFLGSEQTDIDMTASINRVKKILEGREERPPLVVLMSRSTRLHDKKEEFRDGVPLFGTMFRVHTKQELIDGSSLARTIQRLAEQQADARRLAVFLYRWSKGVDDAKARCLKAFRRLDLADYFQIHQLLLELEGQTLGSYVIDVLDRVMQHELEADGPTIDAAEELNKISTNTFSPPYIAGSPDLQDLVYRSIFQNPERLRVTATTAGSPVMLGDIIIRRSRLTPAGKKAADTTATAAPVGAGEGVVAAASTAAPAQIDEDEALIVLTAACDLVRAGTTRVLLLGGKIEPFDQTASTQAGKAKTPIIALSNGERACIRWSLKDAQMVTHAELGVMLKNDGTHVVAFRLRESHALELQQLLLADIGRVGVVAAMPATFAFAVSAWAIDTAGVWRSLETPVLAKEGAVCFAGKNDSPLVMSERAVEELEAGIRALDPASLTKDSQTAVKLLQQSPALRPLLERLPCPKPDQLGMIPLRIGKVGADGAVEKDDKGKPKLETVGYVGHHPQPAQGQSLKGAAFVLVLTRATGE